MCPSLVGSVANVSDRQRWRQLFFCNHYKTWPDTKTPLNPGDGPCAVCECEEIYTLQNLRGEESTFLGQLVLELLISPASCATTCFPCTASETSEIKTSHQRRGILPSQRRAKYVVFGIAMHTTNPSWCHDFSCSVLIYVSYQGQWPTSPT